MAYREIRKDGDPVLRKKAMEVKKLGTWVDRLFEDMEETMRLAKGIGLAAPQIGVSKRIIMVNLEDKKYKLVNPEILCKEGETTEIEGCLSVPGMLGTVKRAKDVVVRALDDKGDEVIIEASGTLAVVLQHEIDHLDGILYVDVAMDVFDEDELDVEEEDIGINDLNLVDKKDK